MSDDATVGEALGALQEYVTGLRDFYGDDLPDDVLDYATGYPDSPPLRLADIAVAAALDLPARDAKVRAEAWDEGVSAAFTGAVMRMNATDVKRNNPYRAALAAAGPVEPSLPESSDPLVPAVPADGPGGELAADELHGALPVTGGATAPLGTELGGSADGGRAAAVSAAHVSRANETAEPLRPGPVEPSPAAEEAGCTCGRVTRGRLAHDADCSGPLAIEHAQSRAGEPLTGGEGRG